MRSSPPFAVVPLLLIVAVGGCIFASRSAPGAADPAGFWEGTVVAGGARLPLMLHLRRDSLRGWHGTLDVPSQSVLGDSVPRLRVDSLAVSFELPDALPPGRLEGTVLDHGRLRGVFAGAIALDTVLGTFELWRRPDPSWPYRAQEVRFPGEAYELAGTVFSPESPGPHPALVFVHGSGPQTRESYIRWFADAFARRGFTTLVYDKRGTGASSGPPVAGDSRRLR